MLACENECRHREYAQLDLNVFGTNRTAINLYEALGYTVSSRQMSKRLRKTCWTALSGTAYSGRWQPHVGWTHRERCLHLAEIRVDLRSAHAAGTARRSPG